MFLSRWKRRYEFGFSELGLKINCRFFSFFLFEWVVKMFIEHQDHLGSSHSDEVHIGPKKVRRPKERSRHHDNSSLAQLHIWRKRGYFQNINDGTGTAAIFRNDRSIRLHTSRFDANQRRWLTSVDGTFFWISIKRIENRWRSIQDLYSWLQSKRKTGKGLLR